MHSRRSLSRVIAAAFGTALLAACGEIDAPTAPRAPVGVALGAQSSLPVVTVEGDTLVTVFTVDPSRRTAHLVGGVHWIVFEARTICDPATSTYGPGEWNRPCRALAAPIQITARSYRDPQGTPRVDFQPALRFWSAQGRDVTLYLFDPRPEASALSVLYCPDVGPCVDEAVADPTLFTQYERQGLFLFREIKHFSGYTIGVGLDGNGFIY